MVVDHPAEHRELQGEGAGEQGAAVRDGCLAAQGRFVLFSDADLATPIEESLRAREAKDAGKPVRKVIVVHKDHRDCKAQLDLRVLKDHKAILVQKVHRVHKAHKD